MSNSRKIVYSATSAAIAALCVTAGVFFPILGFIPLIVAAVCFFIAFECSVPFGLLTIAATVLLSFFLGGATVFHPIFLFNLFIAAPFALLASFIKKLDYVGAKNSLIRASISVVFFNVFFAIIVFAFGPFLTDFLFSVSLEQIYESLNGVVFGYIIMAFVGTAVFVFFDFSFVFFYKTLDKRFKFLRIDKGKGVNKRGGKSVADMESGGLNTSGDGQNCVNGEGKNEQAAAEKDKAHSDQSDDDDVFSDFFK